MCYYRCMNGKNTDGTFATGNSGRPKGAQNKKTIAIRSLLEGQSEALTQTAITKALDGDSVALRLCLERIAPAPKDQPVSFRLPKMNNALDASEAAASVLFDKLNANWEDIKLNLIENVDAQYGVYVDGRFKEALFQSYLAHGAIPWPRLDSGRLALDRNTFSNMSKRYPIVQPLHELRKTLGEFKLNNLAVGRDGRNRTLLSPLAAKTGRNQPSTTKFIFGPAKWIRGLIKPTEGSALAYCDWSSQEIAIAAALSDDDLLWAAYQSGDPYIAFAIQAGLAPPGATKDTHKGIRNRCKSVVLGTNYGMSAYGVAQAAKIHELEAKSLLQKHRETYRKFWAWAENNKDRGLLGFKLETCFGWPIQVTAGDVKANTFLNWPMQAHGAEMMRIASILAVERDIKLCAPIHDALLIEAPSDKIDSEVVRLKECMSEASEAVLGEGKICRVDADIVRHPDRYMDEHGHQMWDHIMGLMDKTQG